MKYLTLFFILLFGLFSSNSVYAADQFTHDLFYGMRNNGYVIALQNFLKNQGLYTGPITGNFYMLTRDSVKALQKREAIQPAVGYFGLKTRTRVNTIFVSLQSTAQTPSTPVVSNTPSIVITPVPQTPTSTNVLASSTPIVTTPTVTSPPPPPPPQPILQVMGSATSTFPVTEMTPLKIGEFVVTNTTSQDILFANFDAVIDDEMDSSANRNKKVNFLLRDGSTAYDSLISQTSFTFVSVLPQIGQPYITPINLPFGVLIKSGQSKTVSMWAEQLGYVKSGTLRINSIRINTTSQQPQGGFNFTLTRTQSL